MKIQKTQSVLLKESSILIKNKKVNKILTPKQMLQKLPIALAQVKAGNTSKNLLIEIRQIIYYLHQEKDVTRKVYNNIMNSVKV